MQQAPAQALAESQKQVDRVEKKLVGTTGSEAFKEYVKDQ